MLFTSFSFACVYFFSVGFDLGVVIGRVVCFGCFGWLDNLLGLVVVLCLRLFAFRLCFSWWVVGLPFGGFCGCVFGHFGWLLWFVGYVCFVLFDCCLVVWFDFGLVVGCFVLVIDLICWFAGVCISSVVWVSGG